MNPPTDPALAPAWPPPHRRPTFDDPHTWLVLLPVRLFLAAGWSRAALEKALDRAWWRGDQVREYLVLQHDLALPFVRPVMDRLIEPGAAPVAIAVLGGELAVGVALALGVAMRPALWTGIILNLSFMLTGRVNPSAFYLVMEVVLLLALDRGLIGHGHREPRRPRLAIAAAWYLAAIGLTPFVHTLDPHHMIDDPALMLSFLAFLVATGHAVAWLHVGREGWVASPPRWVRRISAWSRATVPAPDRPASAPPEFLEQSPSAVGEADAVA